MTGARQANSIRSLYLKTILRQDIGFFDTETTAGEVIGRMSGDTILIENAIGEKVLCQYLIRKPNTIETYSSLYFINFLKQ